MDHTRRAYETVTASAALAVGIVAIIGVILLCGV
jgi:hypothetical protein